MATLKSKFNVADTLFVVFISEEDLKNAYSDNFCKIIPGVVKSIYCSTEHKPEYEMRDIWKGDLTATKVWNEFIPEHLCFLTIEEATTYILKLWQL